MRQPSVLETERSDEEELERVNKAGRINDETDTGKSHQRTGSKEQHWWE